MLTSSDGSPTFPLISPAYPAPSFSARPLPPPLRPPSLLNHRHGPPAPPRNPRLAPTLMSPGHRPSVDGLNVPRRSVFSTFVPTLTWLSLTRTASSVRPVTSGSACAQILRSAPSHGMPIARVALRERGASFVPPFSFCFLYTECPVTLRGPPPTALKKRPRPLLQQTLMPASMIVEGSSVRPAVAGFLLAKRAKLHKHGPNTVHSAVLRLHQLPQLRLQC